MILLDGQIANFPPHSALSLGSSSLRRNEPDRTGWTNDFLGRGLCRPVDVGFPLRRPDRSSAAARSSGRARAFEVPVGADARRWLRRFSPEETVSVGSEISESGYRQGEAERRRRRVLRRRQALLRCGHRPGDRWLRFSLLETAVQRVMSRAGGVQLRWEWDRHSVSPHSSQTHAHARWSFGCDRDVRQRSLVSAFGNPLGDSWNRR